MGWFEGVAKKVRKLFGSDQIDIPGDSKVVQLPYDARMAGSSDFWGGFVSNWLNVDPDLMARFRDYENMDEYPEISSAIDIYADDATQLDSQKNRSIWVTADEPRIEKILDNDLLQVNLRLDDEIWEIARTLVKYGQDYEELLVGSAGVIGLNFLPPPTMRRVEDRWGNIVGFIQDFKLKFAVAIEDMNTLLKDKEKVSSSTEAESSDPQDPLHGLSVFEPWEIVHFRLRSKYRRSVYGYCERKTAKISTDCGVKEIQYLQPGDTVQVFTGFGVKSTKVLSVVCSGSKKVFSIKTKHRENFATAEHPVCVFFKDSGFTYRAVSELQRGDWLVVPAPVEFSGRAQPIRSLDQCSRVRLTSIGVAEFDKIRDSSRYFFEQSGANALGILPRDVAQFCAGVVSLGKEHYEALVKVFPCLGGEGCVVYHGRSRGNFVQCPDFVDADFAWLFGVLLGDGWPSKNNYDVGIALSLDATLTARIVAHLESYGLTPKFRYQKIVNSLGEETSILRQVVVHCADFVDILDGLGFIRGARHKRVPQWVFESPREVRDAVVTGFVDADGWPVHQHGKEGWRIEVCNYDLARDLKALIDGLGWTCGNIGIRKARSVTSSNPVLRGRTIHSGPGFYLHFTKEPLFHGAFKLEKVISVTAQETEPEEVYDIEVDSEYHNFVADGLVVHNSVVETSRWIWRRLTILEDSAVLFRLTKAVERLAFYVDVGDMPASDALAYVNRIRQQYKKRRYVNPSTGQLELRYDALSPDDDFFVPSRSGQESTRIEVLGGPQWQSMEDISYFLNKLFASLKVPKAYLAQEEGVARAVLSSEDVRFARTILRVQRELRAGVATICRVHLMALNIDPTTVKFKVWMTVPSAIFELAQLEVYNARADLAARMQEFVSTPWLLTRVFNLSEKEIEVIFKEKEQDALRSATNMAKGEAAAQKLMPADPNMGPEEWATQVKKVLQDGKQKQIKNSVDYSALSRKLDEVLRNDATLRNRLQDLSKLLKDIARLRMDENRNRPNDPHRRRRIEE